MTKRSFSHWTPRYVMDRAMQILWMRRNPEAPWLSRQAIEFLAQWLSQGDRAMEWGSGRSTVFIARRVKYLISIEHDAKWHKSVLEAIRRESLENVEYRLVERTGDSLRDVIAYGIGPLQEIADNSLDFVLVDGKFRDHCALAVLDKIRPGGLLLIDNAERYISPPPAFASKRKMPVLGPQSEASHWRIFRKAVTGWREVWLSDGIIYDALFFKPRID